MRARETGRGAGGGGRGAFSPWGPGMGVQQSNKSTHHMVLCTSKYLIQYLGTESVGRANESEKERERQSMLTGQLRLSVSQARSVITHTCT